MFSMILEALPDIPRLYTGIAEWAGALVYILIMRPRFRRWRRWLTIVGMLPVMIGLQVFVGMWPLSMWMLGMAAAVLTMFGFVYACTDTSARDAGYLTARAFVLAELVASLQWQLEMYDFKYIVPETFASSTAVRVAFFVVSYAVAYAIAYAMESRNFHRRMRLGIDTRTLVVSVATALVTFLVSNISFLTTNVPFSGSMGNDVFYIRTLVDLAGFVSLYAQQSSHNAIRDALELAQAKIIMRAQHDQYLQSKRNIDELNRMHHDLKHYAAAIRAESSADRRSEYLQALEDSIRGYESEIQTGNNVLDIILASKKERCLQEGITMTTMVDGNALSHIDAIALSTLFGNALDNAIEAEMKVPDHEQRIIKVDVFREGDFVLIRVENYCPWALKFVDGLPETTKNDRSRHGFGTYSIRSVVEEQGGTLTMNLEDQWFILRALLPLT